MTKHILVMVLKINLELRPGIHYCPDYIKEIHKPSEKNAKHYHYWAAVRHNFKSNIHFYELLGKANSKMSQQMYIEEIFDLVIQP